MSSLSSEISPVSNALRVSRSPLGAQHPGSGFEPKTNALNVIVYLGPGKREDLFLPHSYRGNLGEPVEVVFVRRGYSSVLACGTSQYDCAALPMVELCVSVTKRHSATCVMRAGWVIDENRIGNVGTSGQPCVVDAPLALVRHQEDLRRAGAAEGTRFSKRSVRAG